MQSVAAEALTYACNHCHKDALQQKTRILQFLIPVQMLLGKLPSAAIRQKHNMHMYDTIIQVRPEMQIPRPVCSMQKLLDLTCSFGKLHERNMLAGCRVISVSACIADVESG